MKKKLLLIIVSLVLFVSLLTVGIIKFLENKDFDNSENINIGNFTRKECDYEGEKLIIFSTVEKTDVVKECCGGVNEYYAYNEVVENYNYEESDDDLYTVIVYRTYNLLIVSYKDELYYSKDDSFISKFCQKENSDESFSCNYKKITNNIKKLTKTDINYKIKSVGVYSNVGSGNRYAFAVTRDGKVLTIDDTSNPMTYCVAYDDNDYPIDKIFSWNKYKNDEYKLLLSNGTLITRRIDYNNKISNDNNTSSNTDNIQEDNDKQNALENDKAQTILNNIIGTYFARHPSYSKEYPIAYGVDLKKKNNTTEYEINFFQTSSDGFQYGTIKKVTPIKKDTYQLTIYYEPVSIENNLEGFHVGEEDSVILDISKIADGILIINNREYKKYSGNLDDSWNKIEKFLKEEL